MRQSNPSRTNPCDPIRSWANRSGRSDSPEAPRTGRVERETRATNCSTSARGLGPSATRHEIVHARLVAEHVNAAAEDRAEPVAVEVVVVEVGEADADRRRGRKRQLPARRCATVRGPDPRRGAVRRAGCAPRCNSPRTRSLRHKPQRTSLSSRTARLANAYVGRAQGPDEPSLYHPIAGVNTNGPTGSGARIPLTRRTPSVQFCVTLLRRGRVNPCRTIRRPWPVRPDHPCHCLHDGTSATQHTRGRCGRRSMSKVLPSMGFPCPEPGCGVQAGNEKRVARVKRGHPRGRSSPGDRFYTAARIDFIPRSR
jgi:hypothetical protein